MTWLAKVARQLDVPAVLTEEDPSQNGATYTPIADTFPDADALVKPTFGLAETPEIVGRIEGSGRTTAVLIGFETDVCVAQSAIGLKERGTRVIVVEDAVFSPGEMHQRGLARTVAAGRRAEPLQGPGLRMDAHPRTISRRAPVTGGRGPAVPALVVRIGARSED